MYRDYKITQGEVNANNVKSAPDRLQGTTTQNKNIFDKLIELFVSKYNALMDELDDNAYSAIDPITINGYTISHALSGVTQGMYGTNQEQDPQHGEKFIIPYFITDEHGHIVSAGNSEVQLPSGGGGGTTDYDDLTDKPQINSVTLSGNKTSSDLSVADASHTHTKSDITDFPTINDVYWATYGSSTNAQIEAAYQAGKLVCVFTSSKLYTLRYRYVATDHRFVCNYGATQYQIKCANNVWSTDDRTFAMASHTHTVSNITDFPSLATVATSGDYDDLSDKPSIPTNTSDLNNDSGFLTSESDPVFTASDAYGISSTDITAWNNKSDFSGSYNDLTDKPTIPVKNIWYATCSTGASTTAKTATSSTADFTLATGNMVRVLFTNTNTATSPTISIDGSTAKNIRIRSGSTGAMTYMWRDNEVIDLVYDGTNFVMSDGAIATTTYYGITSLSSSTSSTSETESATPKAVKTAYDLANGKADAVHTHTKSDITDFPSLATVATTGDYDDLTDKPTIPTKVSDLNNDSGFISSETDPVFTASDAYGISSSDITSWNGKATGNGRIFYGTCATLGSTQTKVVACSAYDALTKGDIVIVSFTYDNTNTAPKLNVNSKGAKYTCSRTGGNVITPGLTNFNGVCQFMYDGDMWEFISNTNTTYTSGSGSDISTGTSTTNHVWTPKVLHDNLALSTHTHGNITNGGDITSTTTIADGDRLVINDESASKIDNSSITFGTSPSTFLANDGTWRTPTGGGGGTSDYDQLSNRPQINSNTLTGNKSSADLGLADVSHTHTKSQITDFPSIPTITDTYSGTSSDGMSGKAVKSAIDALDGTVTGTAGAGKTLTSFSQTDGKVSATFDNISITKSQVSDFPTIPTVNDATLTIQKNGSTVKTFTANASSNVTANITVPTKTSDLNNDSGFLTSYTETDPVFGASAASGITSTNISDWNGKSVVSVNRKTSSGTNIADITIDGTTTQLYAPTGGGTSDYDTLSNRPQINSTTLTGNKSSSDLGLASASHTHTKSEITDFPSLATVATSGSYSDLSGTPNLATVATSGAYSDLSGTPTIPTKTSDLNNDSGYISEDSSGNVTITGKLYAGAVNFTSFFTVEAESITVSASGAGNQSNTKSVTKAGYTPVGVVGTIVSTTGAYSRGFYLTDRQAGSCTLNVRLYTTGSGNKSCTAYIMWVKTTA